jgi:hypothetical protein
LVGRRPYGVQVVVRCGVTVALCALAVAGCSEGRPASTPGVSDGKTVADVPVVSSGRAAALGLTRKLPAAYQRVCDEQATVAPADARACPPLIPMGRVEVLHADPVSPRPRLGGGYLADLSSASLSALVGKRIETNGGHWHYDVSWTAEARRLLVRRGVERPMNARRGSKCRVLRLGSEGVEACRVVPYAQGGGLNGGHIAYVWSHGPVTYVVSLHGYANEPRARAMTQALMALVLREGVAAGR